MSEPGGEQSVPEERASDGQADIADDLQAMELHGAGTRDGTSPGLSGTGYHVCNRHKSAAMGLKGGAGKSSRGSTCKILLI